MNAQGVAAANLLARLTGLAREIVVSAVFGAGAATDAFNAATRVPNVLRELLVEGSLQNAFVPAFAQASEEDGERGAWALADAFLGALILALGVVTGVFLVFAPAWTLLVASGFSEDKLALTTSLVRWLSPFLAGLSLAGFAAAMLNVRGRFLLPALASNALNVLVLLGALLAPGFERWTGLPAITCLALATTLSGFAQLAICAPALLALGWVPRPTLRAHPGLARVARTLPPALIGIGTVQFNVLVEAQWASAYGDGPLTWMSLAFRLVQLPLAVVAGSIATIALTELSHHVARGDRAATAGALGRALRLNALWTVPAAVGLSLLARPLCALLFERGAFTPDDTAGTAAMLEMYALAVYGICFHRVAVPAYYALRDPWTPMRLSLAAMAAKIPVILLLTRGFGMGVEALPLSHAITVTAESALLALGLAEHTAPRPVLVAHARIAVAAAIMGLSTWFLRDVVPVVPLAAGAGALYLTVAWALGERDFGRGPPGLPPTVDGPTRDALRALASGTARFDGARVVGADAAWVARTAGKTLRFEVDPSAIDPTRAPGPAAPVFAVLEPGAPPTLRGLVVDGRAWHADGGALVAGASAGPRIAVTP